MTEEQREAVKRVFREIQRLPRGDMLELCADGFSIVTIQYAPNRRFGASTNIGTGCTEQEIRDRMMDIYNKTIKSLGEVKK